MDKYVISVTIKKKVKMMGEFFFFVTKLGILGIILDCGICKSDFICN